MRTATPEAKLQSERGISPSTPPVPLHQIPSGLQMKKHAGARHSEVSGEIEKMPRGRHRARNEVYELRDIYRLFCLVYAHFCNKKVSTLSKCFINKVLFSYGDGETIAPLEAARKVPGRLTGTVATLVSG